MNPFKPMLQESLLIHKTPQTAPTTRIIWRHYVGDAKDHNPKLPEVLESTQADLNFIWATLSRTPAYLHPRGCRE